METRDLLKHLSSATFEVRTGPLLTNERVHWEAVQKITNALIEAGVNFKTDMRRGNHTGILSTHITVGLDMAEEKD